MKSQASTHTRRRSCESRYVLTLIVSCALLSQPACHPGQETPTSLPEKPHIVLLILDTLRADRLASYSRVVPRDVSRELDQLASRGVRFDRAIAPSSWTRPSVGALLTSRHPRALGIYEERVGALPDSFTTLAEALKAAGYRTLGLTANPNLNRIFNFHQGFDDYVESSVVWKWMPRAPNQAPRSRAPLPSAPELFARALDWLEASEDRATFVLLDLMEIHEHARPDQVLRPEYADLYRSRPGAAYLRNIRQLSDDVGAFVREVSALEGHAETLFVITSDHGEGLRSHPAIPDSRFHGRLLYDSQNWVPLIFFHSGSGGLPAGTVVERPVRLLDVMPTLLEIAGAPPPPGMEGRSLLPLLTDPGADLALPEYFVAETQFRGADKIALYGEELKLIVNRRAEPGTRRVELQPNRIQENGIATDVGEARPEDRARMQAYLERWIEENPMASREETSRDLTQEEEEQLRAIGYAP